MNKDLSNILKSFFDLKGQCYEQVLEDLNLTELSFKQLRYIKKLNTEEGITVSQIAEAFELSKPTVTEMIKKFVKEDLVYKQTCITDGRVHYIKLTEKGRGFATLEDRTLAYVEKLLKERLNDKEIEHLIIILSKL